MQEPISYLVTEIEFKFVLCTTQASQGTPSYTLRTWNIRDGKIITYDAKRYSNNKQLCKIYLITEHV